MACPRFWIDVVDTKGYRTHHSSHKNIKKALTVYSSLCFPEGGTVEVFDPEGHLITTKSWPHKDLSEAYYSKDP